jgi:hypothetical protein
MIGKTPTKLQNEWMVVEVNELEDSLILTFRYIELSQAFFNNKDSYLAFQKTFRSTSGQWKEARGYWYTMKLIVKEIECKGTSQYKKQEIIPELVAKSLKPFVKFSKSTSSDSIKVNVESKFTGIFEFNCKSINYTDHYEIYLKHPSENELISATHLFDGQTSNFIGKI